MNAAQREALLEPGNTVLLAGPGSGKTATLVLKIARLLDQTPPPHGIACLTYGTEAAREFETRLGELGIRKGGRLFTGTVHAFCLAHVLRPFGWRLRGALRDLARFDVASDVEVARARQEGLDAASINEPDSWWSSKLSAYRRVVLLDPARGAEFDDRLPAVAAAYEGALRAARRIDFDDIVNTALVLIESDSHVRDVLVAKFPWLLVDEYQDLGLALHRIVVAMMERAGARVFAVGDPDQSIYNFAGARPEFLDALANRSDVRQIRLTLNYRCPQNIIDASLHILQPGEERGFTAANESDASAGDILFHRCEDGLAEQAQRTVALVKDLVAAGVPHGDIGILAMRWQDLQDFEEHLTAEGIPFRVSKSPSYKPTQLTQWVEDLAAWCAGGWRRGCPRLIELFQVWGHVAPECGRAAPARDRLDSRIELYQMLRSLRDPSMEVGKWLDTICAGLGLRELASNAASVPLRLRHDAQEIAAMIQALERSRQRLDEFSGLARDKVVLQTIHGSKGREYTAVFIAALENGVIPRPRENISEPRRLFYVALTRSRRVVHLLWSGFFFTATGQLRQNGPSPLLRELGRRLLARPRAVVADA